MAQATFRFHGSLNFFLPSDRRDSTFTHEFDWKGSIKDRVESLGVPHPEIEALVVNGRAVDFTYIIQSGDHIEVYGSDTAPAGPIILRPPYPGRPAFVLDQHLGRLAAYLRMLGFDTLYRNDYHDEELAQISDEQTRILLTRDIGLLKRGRVVYGYYVRETNRHRQLAEITQRFRLLPLVAPFKHCMKCNGLLESVHKAQINHHLPDATAHYYDEFHRCCSCGRVYWKGPHYQRMQSLIDEIIRDG
jgi:uncharacterized protein with PIN domain